MNRSESTPIQSRISSSDMVAASSLARSGVPTP